MSGFMEQQEKNSIAGVMGILQEVMQKQGLDGEEIFQELAQKMLVGGAK